VIEAIENENFEHLSEELGDLLLHIVFQSRLAEEENHFKINDVLDKINQKLINRHPHVFGNAVVKDSIDVKMNWERIKQQEKKHVRESVIDGVPKGMPALIIAHRVQEKAASVGFDWKDIEPVFEKMKEEFQEFEEAFKKQDVENIEEELGDILFTMVNLTRKLNIDGESALKKSTKKFEKRFKKIEQYHRDRKENIYDSSLEKLDEIWNQVKKD